MPPKVCVDRWDQFRRERLVVIAPSQWNQPHTITVVGQDDNLSDGIEAYTIQSQTTSTDPSHQGLTGMDVAVEN
ncbi:MAG: hypothetical protein R3C05_27555 [Pirellulaceae bacterium]